MTYIYKLKSCSGLVGTPASILQRSNRGERQGVPPLRQRDRRAESLYLDRGQTLRQNQVTLSHIHLSASVCLPAPAQRELSSGLCRGISRYRVERKRGGSGRTRRRERVGQCD